MPIRLQEAQVAGKKQIILKVRVSICWIAGGAPPPPARVGPHPHALPALASLAPMVSDNGVPGSAMGSNALRKLIQAARSLE